MNKIIIALSLLLGLSSCANSGEKEVTQDAGKTEEVGTPKKVLFVLTSHDELGDTGEKTGFWIEEFATPYYYMLDNSVEITIASPMGGQPAIDPKSALADYATESTKRFNKDNET